MGKNPNPIKTGMPRVTSREMAQIVAVFCSVNEKLRAQVVGHPKVVWSEQPSLEITEAIFAAR